MENDIIKFIKASYKKGHRTFTDLDIDSGDLSGENLEGIIFDGCFLAVDFQGANLKGSKFLNGNIKTCDFGGADLTNAEFRNVAVESVNFTKAKTEGLIFENNSCYSRILNQEDFLRLMED